MPDGILGITPEGMHEVKPEWILETIPEEILVVVHERLFPEGFRGRIPWKFLWEAYYINQWMLVTLCIFLRIHEDISGGIPEKIYRKNS